MSKVSKSPRIRRRDQMTMDLPLDLKKAFNSACALRGEPMQRVLRKAIEAYIRRANAPT